MITNEKRRALAQYLNIPNDDTEEMNNMELCKYDDNIISIYKEDYLVLTDGEADERAADEIKETLWAFNTSFILDHCNNQDMSTYEWDTAKKALEEIQGNYAEMCNGLVRALISDLDDFIDDAIQADGRGHFISHYDGEEHEESVDGVTYYIYRL